jgi:hypothetical protein
VFRIHNTAFESRDVGLFSAQRQRDLFLTKA